MFNKLMARVYFRLGKTWKNPGLLRKSARLNRRNLVLAVELAKYGHPEMACSNSMDLLAAISQCSKDNQLTAEAAHFVALVGQNFTKSYSQLFQDIAALHCCGDKTSGYFVEVGVGNGVSLSNTYFLENSGWNGLLIEADRRFHHPIEASRQARLFKQAAFSEDHLKLDFVENAAEGELSTLARHSNADSRTRSGEVYSVETLTLKSMLAQAQAPQVIDYISIDTEGSEMDVLAGMDFQQYDVRFLTIEHNYVAGKKQEIIEMLKPYGFREVLPEFSSFDVWLSK